MHDCAIPLRSSGHHRGIPNIFGGQGRSRFRSTEPLTATATGIGGGNLAEGNEAAGPQACCVLLEGHLNAPQVEFEVHTLEHTGTTALIIYEATSLYSVLVPGRVKHRSSGPSRRDCSNKADQVRPTLSHSP